MGRVWNLGLALAALVITAPVWAEVEVKDASKFQATVYTAAPGLRLYDTVPLDSYALQGGKFTINLDTKQDLWIFRGTKRAFATLDFGDASPWNTFSFVLGTFVPYQGYTGPVAIEVFADGRRIYGQSFTTVQATQQIQLNVAKVRTVTITVDPVCATEDTANPRALSLYIAAADFDRTPTARPAPALAPAPVPCRAPLVVREQTFTQPAPAPVRARW